MSTTQNTPTSIKHYFAIYDLNFIRFIREYGDTKEVLYTLIPSLDFIDPTQVSFKYDSGLECGGQLFDVIVPDDADAFHSVYLGNPLFAQEINRIANRLFNGINNDVLRKLFHRHKEILLKEPDVIQGPDFTHDVMSMIAKELSAPYVVEYTPTKEVVELVSNQVFPIPNFYSPTIYALFKEYTNTTKDFIQSDFEYEGFIYTTSIIQLENQTLGCNFSKEDVDNKEIEHRFIIVDSPKIHKDLYHLFNPEFPDNQKVIIFNELFMEYVFDNDELGNDSFVNSYSYRYLGATQDEIMDVVPIGNKKILIGSVFRPGEIVVSDIRTFNRYIEDDNPDPATTIHFISTPNGLNSKLKITDLVKMMDREFLSAKIYDFSNESEDLRYINVAFKLTTEALVEQNATAILEGYLEKLRKLPTNHLNVS